MKELVLAGQCPFTRMAAHYCGVEQPRYRLPSRSLWAGRGRGIVFAHQGPSVVEVDMNSIGPLNFAGPPQKKLY